MYTNKVEYRTIKKVGEKGDSKRITVQNDALSIKQIIERYSNGIPVQFRQSEYLDVEDIRKINAFYGPAIDLTDLDTLSTQIGNLNDTAQALQKQLDAIKDDEKPAEEEPDAGT